MPKSVEIHFYQNQLTGKRFYLNIFKNISIIILERLIYSISLILKFQNFSSDIIMISVKSTFFFSELCISKFIDF